MTTPRPKLLVLKCRCGCGMWAAFIGRPKFNEHGIAARAKGMYAPTWAEAVRDAIRWSTHEVGGHGGR